MAATGVFTCLLLVSRGVDMLGHARRRPVVLFGAACWLGVALGVVADGDSDAGLWTAAALVGLIQGAVFVTLDKHLRKRPEGGSAARRAGDVLGGSQPCTVILSVYIVMGCVIGALAVLSHDAGDACTALPLLSTTLALALGVAATLPPPSSSATASMLSLGTLAGVCTALTTQSVCL